MAEQTWDKYLYSSVIIKDEILIFIFMMADF